jgi:hypothetical protein
MQAEHTKYKIKTIQTIQIKSIKIITTIIIKQMAPEQQY